MKDKRGKSLCEKGEVKLQKLLKSTAEPDNCILFGFSESRLEDIQRCKSQESINAATKSKLIRRWTMDERLGERLHIISIELTS